MTLSLISAGDDHSCALTPDGVALCWGRNDRGQLGDATQDRRPTAAPVSGSSVFVDIGTGDAHTCALTREGQAYCWGSNHSWQLGLGGFPRDQPSDRLVPTPVSGELEFTQISVGAVHTCGLGVGGQAYCWGSDKDGQVGEGDLRTYQHLEPVPVQGDMIFSSISAGGWGYQAGNHTCALTAAGKAYCWGRGGLGDGVIDPQPRTTPTPVVGDFVFVSISAGGGHTCALTEEGIAYCWGANGYGQLGGGRTLGSVTEPRPVPGSHRFVSISAGGSHTCGLVASGDALCWGHNFMGALGDGTTLHRVDVVTVTGGLHFENLSAGTFHTCAVTVEEEGYCWGHNLNWQLGVGWGDPLQYFQSRPTLLMGR